MTRVVPRFALIAKDVVFVTRGRTRGYSVVVTLALDVARGEEHDIASRLREVYGDKASARVGLGVVSMECPAHLMPYVHALAALPCWRIRNGRQVEADCALWCGAIVSRIRRDLEAP